MTCRYSRTVGTLAREHGHIRGIVVNQFTYIYMYSDVFMCVNRVVRMSMRRRVKSLRGN